MYNEIMKNIDEYHLQFEGLKKERLDQIRKIIKECAPMATERISWSMPTFYLNGNLVHYAMSKNHLGFYPGASGVERYVSKYSGHKYSKGAIQFPLDKPLPVRIIKDIVKFRVKEQTK